MTRTGSPTGFNDASFTAFVAVELQFDSGTVRLWNGYGDLTVDGDTYTGAGTLINISAIEESTEIAAKGVKMSLQGISSDILSVALTENYRYRLVNIYIGTIDNGTVDSYQVFSGRMDVMTIQESGETCNIALTAENRLIDLERARVRRYTSQDQRLIDSTDKGFNFINSQQSKVIRWGG